MPDLPPRCVTLMLCTRDGNVLGVLPSYEVAFPYWQDVTGVVEAARTAYDIDVTVLRVLGGDAQQAGPGGPVTYLAEVEEPPQIRLTPAPAKLHDHPLRQRWARPGGPAEDLRWADEQLDRHGIRRVDDAEQVRTWNLSSLWRLPTDQEAVWLKAVPPFFAHEGAVLALLGRTHRDLVPHPLACDDGRVLLPEVPGPDLYEATGPVLLEMVDLLVEVQAAYADRVEALTGAGVPDWRWAKLADGGVDVLARTPELDRETVRAVAYLLGSWDERVDAVDACGLPMTLVHGDFHPGNLRGGAGALTLLDWGDSGIGHPLLDQAAFLDRIPPEDRKPVAQRWATEWRATVPGSDPVRAADLLAPMAALRQAVIYRRFLDRIEPDEHVYHRGDPATWLRRTAELVTGSGTR